MVRKSELVSGSVGPVGPCKVRGVPIAEAQSIPALDFAPIVGHQQQAISRSSNNGDSNRSNSNQAGDSNRRSNNNGDNNRRSNSQAGDSNRRSNNNGDRSSNNQAGDSQQDRDGNRRQQDYWYFC